MKLSNKFKISIFLVVPFLVVPFILFLICGIHCTAKYITEYFSGFELFLTHCSALKLLPRTLFPTCLFLLPCLLFVILLFGFLRAIKKNVSRLAANKKILNRLSVITIKNSVKVKKAAEELHLIDKICIFESDNLLYAFSSGYLKPMIYLSTGLVENLSMNELRAVLLHEKYHIIQKDNIKLLFIIFFEDWLFFLPVFKKLSMLFHELIERAADKRVVEVFGDPLKLARMLLRIAESNNRVILEEPALSVIGHNCIENRIKYLVNNKETVFPPTLKSVFISLLIGTILFVPFFYRVFISEKESFKKFENSINIICDEHQTAHGKNYQNIGENDYINKNIVTKK